MKNYIKDYYIATFIGVIIGLVIIEILNIFTN